MTSTTIIKPADIKGMTVADLKAFCIRKNIPIKGLKLRAQFEKAIESHALTPVKITSAEADQLLQKPENSQQNSEIQNKGWWDAWRDCLQYDADGNCITKAQILTPQSEKYVGQICSVVVTTSAVGAVLEAEDGHKMFCCYPDEFKLVADFSGAEYWECQNDLGVWVEFTHIDSESAPHRKRQISQSEYDRRTQPAQPQGHNVMPNSDSSGAGGGDKKPPIVATGGAGDEMRDPLKLNSDRVPEYFGDRIHRADDSGQLNLLDLDEDEAPDPDDYLSHEGYLIAWDKWKASHPEFKEGDDYPAIGSRRFAAEINLIDELLTACKKGEVDRQPTVERSPVERPIIFSAPMVRAILKGSKTQTRRLVKPQPQMWGSDLWLFKENEDSAVVWQCSEPPSGFLAGLCPHGVVGDKLWVRETFAASRHFINKDLLIYSYRADFDNSFTSPLAPWKPSIHMPRKACRLILEITNIRMERLRDISEEDAVSEGVQSREDFERLWNSLYSGTDWQSNPWVWVVEFKVLKDG